MVEFLVADYDHLHQEVTHG